jgi:subtilisin-like proprotein convertase family protein
LKYLYTILFISLFTANHLLGQAPANDDCAGAIPLTVGSTCNFTQYSNANATASAVANPGCASYSGGDVWFSAVVPLSGSLIFDSNTGIVTDGGMALYSGTCGALTLLACDDDGSANGLMPSLSQTGLTPGSTVYIRFWEYGNNNNGTFSLCARSFSCNAVNNANCANADPFCTGVSYDYCNTTNVPSIGQGTFPPGTGYNAAYGCLGSSPNPAFYYTNVSSSGPIDFNISQSTNTGVPIDVDFIMWGPFASQAAMCSGISAGNIIDCSYSTAAVEQANIPNAIAGQWYLVLITNYSNQAGVINFSQTNSGQAGAGTTNCNILTAIPGTCVNGLYTLTGSLQVQSPPATGTLTITNSCGGTQTINAPFISPISYSIPNLCGNGQSCTVTGVFSAVGAQTILPASYTAPSCPVLTANAGACVGGTYVMSGTLTVGASCLPSTGTLTITSSCGGNQVINAPFLSPLNWSLPPTNGNGGNCTITAVYSAPGAPIITPITLAQPTCCSANAGTVTTSISSGAGTISVNGNTTEVILCQNSSVSIINNNNYTLPTPGCPGCIPGLMYAIYVSPGPTVSDPELDPNWTNYFWTLPNVTGTNNGALNINSAGSCSPLFQLPSEPGYASMNPQNNTFVFVPITGDAQNLPNHDNNGDGCFDIGDPISITYLNPITFNASPTCNGNVSIQILGGYPQFFNGLYTITNTGPGTLSSTSATSGGSVTISGLTPGQTYSISVSDGGGCAPVIFSGTFNGAPTVSINPASSPICVGGCVNLSATVNSGVGNNTLTFSSDCTPIQIPDGGIGSSIGPPNIIGGNWAQSCINVAGLCNATWNTGEIISVNLNISHTWDGDLDIYLQAPNGAFYLLSRDNGGLGDNYTNTTFSATAATNITGGSAPFSGSFIPQGGAGNFAALNGTSINGTWCLWVADDLIGDQGTILNWSLQFANDNSYTYIWSPTAGLSATNSLSPTACPTLSTTYTLTATNSCGCTTSASTVIDVNPPPVVDVSPISICNGSTGTLIATGATTYTWAPATGLSASSGASVTANPTITTTYTVTGTIGVGCSGTATAIVTVNPSQTPTFNPVGPYCSGSVIPALPTTSNEGITGTWSPVINNAATTVYTFTPTVGQCASVANTTIIINPLPLVSVSPSSDNICDGDILTLTANGADSIYSWSPNINISSTTSNPVNVNPSVNTTYTVIGTDINGCTGQASAVITVSPIVTPIFPPIPALCVNDTPPLLPTTSINGITGTWSPTTINTSAPGSTTYTFTPNDPNQCGETITTSVTIDPLPFTTPIFHD